MMTGPISAFFVWAQQCLMVGSPTGRSAGNGFALQSRRYLAAGTSRRARITSWAAVAVGVSL